MNTNQPNRPTPPPANSLPSPNFTTHIPSLPNTFATPPDNADHSGYYNSLNNSSSSNKGRLKAVFIGILVFCAFFAYRRWHGSAAMAAWQDNWEKGVDQSEANKKPQLVLFTADWCPACNQLEENVLSQKEVTDKLKGTFILTKIDLSERGGPNNQIAHDFGVSVIPTMFIVGPDGARSSPLTGSVSFERMAQWIGSAKLSKPASR